MSPSPQHESLRGGPMPLHDGVENRPAAMGHHKDIDVFHRVDDGPGDEFARPLWVRPVPLEELRRSVGMSAHPFAELPRASRMVSAPALDAGRRLSEDG